MSTSHPNIQHTHTQTLRPDLSGQLGISLIPPAPFSHLLSNFLSFPFLLLLPVAYGPLSLLWSLFTWSLRPHKTISLSCMVCIFQASLLPKVCSLPYFIGFSHFSVWMTLSYSTAVAHSNSIASRRRASWEGSSKTLYYWSGQVWSINGKGGTERRIKYPPVWIVSDEQAATSFLRSFLSTLFPVCPNMWS